MIVAETAVAQQNFTAGKIFSFPAGIPGFEKYTKFHVFHKQENEICAYWLESVDDPKVTFTLVDPTIYDLHYELNLTDEEQELLQADGPESCAVFMMLSKSVEEDSTDAKLHANIAGPLIINLERQIGVQKVVTRSNGKVSIVKN